MMDSHMLQVGQPVTYTWWDSSDSSSKVPDPCWNIFTIQSDSNVGRAKQVSQYSNCLERFLGGENAYCQTQTYSSICMLQLARNQSYCNMPIKPTICKCGCHITGRDEPVCMWPVRWETSKSKAYARFQNSYFTDQIRLKCWMCQNILTFIYYFGKYGKISQVDKQSPYCLKFLFLETWLFLLVTTTLSMKCIVQISAFIWYRPGVFAFPRCQSSFTTLK